MLVSYLDEDPISAARCVDDMRTAKLCTEAAQLLCGAYRLALPHGAEPPYKPTHANHPYYDWLLESRENARWLLAHAWALWREHRRRFGTETKTVEVLDWLEERRKHFDAALPTAPFTDPPLLDSMPEAAREERSRVRAYRIHAVSKPRWRWLRAERPGWWDVLAGIHNRRFVPACGCEGWTYAECRTCGGCGREVCPDCVRYDLTACAKCDPDAHDVAS